MTPGDGVGRLLLPLAWPWPVLIWSAMGARETRYRTGEIVFSAVHTLRLDFMGVTSGLGTLTCAGLFTVQVAGLPWYYLSLTAVLLALAALGRWRQTRGWKGGV